MYRIEILTSFAQTFILILTNFNKNNFVILNVLSQRNIKLIPFYCFLGVIENSRTTFISWTSLNIFKLVLQSIFIYFSEVILFSSNIKSMFVCIYSNKLLFSEEKIT